MGIFFALLTALGWGTADILLRYVTRLFGSYRTMFYMPVIGLLGLSIYLLWTGELQFLMTHKTWDVWAWAIGTTVMLVLTGLALYRAFEVGETIVVSPITAGYAAVTAGLSMLSGERIAEARLGGMAAVIIGVVMVATPLVRPKQAGKSGEETVGKGRRNWLPRGVGWAILSSIGNGICFWLLGFHVTPELGALTTTWLGRLMAPLLLALCAPLAGQSLRLPGGRAGWGLLIGLGIIDTVAFVTYNLGVTQGQVSVVSVIASLYSAVTVLLAWIFVHERLQWSQWIGIVVVFGGIALVNL